MSPEDIAQIAGHYASAGAWDRFHVKQRLRFFPHDVLLPHLPERGNLLDIGCGFGLLAWYLARKRPALTYYGSDIDTHKIDVAQSSFRTPSAPAVRLYAGDARVWPERPATFDVVALLDVLLLLPMGLQRELFDFACKALEPGAQARLILKVQPFMRGRALLRTFVQETIMVNLLRKTRTSGALHFRQDPELYARWGKEYGLACEHIEVPTYPPSTLLVLRRS